MEPPWLKYPDRPAGSIGWRMGGGEDYLAQFEEWFRSLSHTEQEVYARTNPPPRAWRGYGTFRGPPWPKQNALDRVLALSVGKLVAAALVFAAIIAVLLATL
jgi:hypothetical protein